MAGMICPPSNNYDGGMALKFKDYYEVLKVARGASADEIKKAYRKLVKEHHPDLHPESQKAERTQRMQEVNEAYSVLGDPANRAKYDKFGENWKEGQEFRPPPDAGFREQDFGGGREGFGGRASGGGAEAFSDFFSQFFGGGAGGGRGPAGFEEPEAPAASLDIEAALDLPLEDAVRGGEKAFSLDVSGLCSACGGTGRRGRAFCPTCGGAGETTQRRDVRVRLPPNLHDGSRIRVKGKGRERGGRAGDLYLVARLRPDSRWRVSGSDLEAAVRVMPWTAALGGEAEVPTPEGAVRVKIPPGTRAGKTLRLSGRGLGRPGGGRGDLLARVELDLPASLSERAKALYKQLEEEARGS